MRTENPLPRTLLQSGMWQRRDIPCLEVFKFQSYERGFVLGGTILAAVEAEPVEAHYVVFCTATEIPRAVHLTVVRGGLVHLAELRHDASGHWQVDGEHRPDLDGALDLDFTFSPAMHRLIVRRMNLAEGASGEVSVVEAGFPNLELSRSTRRYTRVSSSTYHVENQGEEGGADLRVDVTGFVTSYDNRWTRIADHSA